MLTSVFLNMLLDGLIAVLLCVTIAYCWVLNRRIKVLQDGRGELALLLKHFDESTKRASDSIIALQGAGKRIGESIELRMEKAGYVLEDLAYMIDKAEKIANKLEAGFAVNRARSRVMGDPPLEAPRRAEPVKPPERVAREEEAVEPPERSQPWPAVMPPLSGGAVKKPSSLEMLLEKVAARVKTPVAEDSAEPPQRQRSKAEQELIDMLKTGIRG